MDLKNKVIKLDNNDEYVVADSFTYSNKVYLVLGKLIGEENIEEQVTFAELVGNKVRRITDSKEIEKIEEIYKLSLN